MSKLRAVSPDDWDSARVIFKQFCENNPGFGMAGTQWSFVAFERTHGQAMREAGVMLKTVNHKHLANKKLFNEAAFRRLTLTEGEPK